MPDRIVIAHGTTDEWAQETLPLALAEPGLDTVTGELKFGDGNTLWQDLPAFTPVDASSIAVIDDTVATGSGRSDATLSSAQILSLLRSNLERANAYADRVAAQAGGPRWVPVYQNADGSWPVSTAGPQDGTLAIGVVGVGTAPTLPKLTDLVILQDPA